VSEQKRSGEGTSGADRAPRTERPPGAPEETRASEPAREKRPFNFWRLAATMSTLGWSLVLPIVAGALLGNYLDKVTGREYIWTVGLLFTGVAISLYNLYHILYKETID